MQTALSGAALEVVGLTKRYGGTVALDNVTAQFGVARICGLVGINGSGKSTLIKIVSGIEPPTSVDRVSFYGRRHSGELSPAACQANGVRVLHQRPAQFLDLSVTENLLLPDIGQGPIGTFSWRKAHERVRKILRSVDMDIDPAKRFGRFSPAERTMALIAKLLYQEEADASGQTPRIIILDEPTAALPEAGALWLMEKLKLQKAAGHTIVYVSHRLDELFYVTDELTVLRDGRLIETIETSSTSEQALVTTLLGHELRPAATKSVRETSEAGAKTSTPRIEVQGLAGKDAKGVDFAIQSGEIVGLTGIIGSGFLEVVELIFGIGKPAAGEIRLDGKRLAAGHPCEAMRAGIGLVPSDRTEMAVFPAWTVAENLSIPQSTVAAGTSGDAGTVIGTYGIKASGAKAPLWTLSGGNQQKVVLARWLERNPKLLLLCEPTAGVDPGARDDLHRLIRAAAGRGCAVIVASTDADELEALAHRTLVVNRGRVSAEIEGGPGSKLRIREKIL
jgi:ribose transport system ATP-binding protein